jgi:negative regulator of flagellin synthesis FlgM
MVDSINPSLARARIQKTQGDTPAPSGSKGAASAGSVGATAATDSVSLSAAAAQKPTSVDETNPPFDVEAVKRIKAAISSGNYPVDLDRITDSLFEGYRELMM